MKVLSKDLVRKIILNNKLKSYTYVLLRKDGTPFYVGVGIRSRVLQHGCKYDIEKCTNRHKINVIKQELSLFGYFNYAIICINSDREVCLNAERTFISKFGRKDISTGVLTNLTDGGEQGPNGAINSLESKLRKSIIGTNDADNRSRVSKKWWVNLSPEEKDRRLSILINSNKTELTLEKLSEKSIESWKDPLVREKRLRRMAESRDTAASKNSDIMKQKWQDPEFREMMKNARRRNKHSPDVNQ